MQNTRGIDVDGTRTGPWQPVKRHGTLNQTYHKWTTVEGVEFIKASMAGQEENTNYCGVKSLVKFGVLLFWSSSTFRPWGEIDFGEANGSFDKNMKYNGKRLEEILESHARFTKGDKNGVRADLSGANLAGANLHGANLAYALLREANLEGADLGEARLGGADFSGAKMKRADLRRADLTETNLAGADLSEAQLGGVECFRADLGNAILCGANLRAANFRGTNLRGADLRGADVTTSIFRETDLEGVNLSGLDLSATLMPRGWKAPQEAKK